MEIQPITMMRKAYATLLLILTVGVAVQAGNPDRAGESGAPELTITPWIRLAGLHGMNNSRVMGIEAMNANVAGLAFTRKTEFVFSRAHWLQGSDIYIHSAGIAQKFGKSKANVLGISLMSFDFGDIQRTTTSNPEGGLGTFKPQFFNIGLAFSREFSKRIYAGALVRIISEKIDDLSAFGFCVDLGIQYVTGKLDNARFGIALRNVGTPMSFSGDGLVFRGNAPEAEYQQSLSQRTEKYELPSLLNIGVSYDIYLDNIKNDKTLPHDHRLSVIINYTAYSFGKDNVGGGLEYSWKDYLMIRGGYRWEKGLTSGNERTTVFTGFSAGASFQFPLKKGKENPPTIGLDYAFQATSPFSGVHYYGLRFNL
ncbi:MAG: hypothetical protein KatS3mg031_1543 [Chitinophagales bacterium]|nr:MAG: hypothetical protein KatS3mg031_1543 [Chitinophagales bacterium]